MSESADGSKRVSFDLRAQWRDGSVRQVRMIAERADSETLIGTLQDVSEEAASLQSIRFFATTTA